MAESVACSSRRLISIVVPVYNEAENIPLIIPRADAALAPLRARYDVEFVFTDNHSTDGSFALLAQLVAADPRVRVLRFSRNFGYQKSIRAGYFAAAGDCIAQLDADLQDPPEIIRDFVAEWEKGAKVVYGVRRSRQEGRALTFVRRAFYRVIQRLADSDLPLDAGDFRLVDRRIVEELRIVQGASPYLRGEIAGLGFRQKGVVYDRAARARGHTKFSPLKLIDFAIDGIATHSVIPLRVASYVGLSVFAVTLIAALAYLVNRMFFATWPAGFATTTILQLLSISLNALFLGVIGEYVARIYRELATRRDVVVEQRLGFPVSTDAAAGDERR